MSSQINALWLAEYEKDKMLVRFPFSDRAVKVLCSLVPDHYRQKSKGYGWQGGLSAWVFPLEYWEEVEEALGQIFTKVPIHIVDELPELQPLDVSKFE